MKNSGVAGTQSSVRRLGCWVWARNNETKQALLRLRYTMMRISRGRSADSMWLRRCERISRSASGHVPFPFSGLRPECASASVPWCPSPLTWQVKGVVYSLVASNLVRIDRTTAPNTVQCLV